MLKIVGTSHGKVVDEKILIDDSNKITKYGLLLLGVDRRADVSVVYLISEIIKMLKHRG